MSRLCASPARRDRTVAGVLLGAMAAALPASALAFNVISFDGVNVARWRDSDLPVHYRIQSSFPATSGSDDEAAIHASFDAWEAVSCTDIASTFDGATSGNSFTARDGINKVVHTTSGFSSTTGGALGVTYVEYTGDAVGNWWISGGDIALNAYVQWSTTGATDRFDVQGVVTHEVGHLLGMQHSPSPDATMYYAEPPGDTGARSLHTDDSNGICFLYPRATFSCSSSSQCPTLETGEQDSYGNPEIWGTMTCATGRCSLSGAPPTNPLGALCTSGTQCTSSICITDPGSGNQICSQTCTGSCPAGFTCRDFGATDYCTPTGSSPLGTSCTSSATCASNLCVGISETEGVCSQTCSVGVAGACPEDFLCLSGSDGTGYCIERGPVPFGSPCTSSLECDGLVCIGVRDGDYRCSQDCDVSNAYSCPTNALCYRIDAENMEICLPGGSGARGTACDELVDCRNSLCVTWNEAGDFRCADACVYRPGIDNCGAGYTCADYDGINLDACLPEGAGDLGDSCDSGYDCASLLCVDDTEPFCSEYCSGSCATGFECEPLSDGESSACFPAPPPPDVSPVDAGPSDVSPVDAGPPDLSPVDARPIDVSPIDARPTDATPVETGPADTSPIDATPSDAPLPDTADGAPDDATPVDGSFEEVGADSTEDGADGADGEDSGDSLGDATLPDDIGSGDASHDAAPSDDATPSGDTAGSLDTSSGADSAGPDTAGSGDNPDATDTRHRRSRGSSCSAAPSRSAPAPSAGIVALLLVAVTRRRRGEDGAA